MSNTVSGVDYVSAPKDYAELFRRYYPYVVNLVNKNGIADDNKEDVASEILARFFERGFLEKFDPALVFSYAGQPRPARFKSFLSKFVLTYVRGHYDKQKRLRTREIMLCDHVMSGFYGIGVRWVDVYGEAHPDHQDEVLEGWMERQLVVGLRNFLADVPRKSVYDRCDLVALFDAVMVQVRDKGEYDITELKEIFGVSSTAMHTWVWWLKQNIAEALGHPVPAKRPRTTRVKDTLDLGAER